MAIAKGNVQAINYFVANNYVKALEAIAKSPNQKILMMPLEAVERDRLAGRPGRDHQRGVRQGRQRRADRPRAPRAPGQRAADVSLPARLGDTLGRITHAGLSAASTARALELVHPGRAALHPRDHVPGVHFLWFGLAAVVVGVLALAIGVAWPWQVMAFGVISVLTVFWVRKYARPDVAISDLPDLNVRGQQYIGRSLVVEQAIQNGRGKVRVGDSTCGGRGPGCAGRRARDRHGGQGHRAGGGACNGLTRARARSRGSSRSSAWRCPGSAAVLGLFGALASRPRRASRLVVCRCRRRAAGRRRSDRLRLGASLRLQDRPARPQPPRQPARRPRAAWSRRRSRTAAARCASATRCGSPKGRTPRPAPQVRVTAAQGTVLQVEKA